MLKNRAGDDILVSLNRTLNEGERVDGIYIKDIMNFIGVKSVHYMDSFNRPTLFHTSHWVYPYSVLNFINIDYCIYNRLRKPDRFVEFFFVDKIPCICVGVGDYRMVGSRNLQLNPDYIEWVDENSISINIGGETMMLF